MSLSYVYPMCDGPLLQILDLYGLLPKKNNKDKVANEHGAVLTRSVTGVGAIGWLIENDIGGACAVTV